MILWFFCGGFVLCYLARHPYGLRRSSRECDVEAARHPYGLRRSSSRECDVEAARHPYWESWLRRRGCPPSVLGLLPEQRRVDGEDTVYRAAGAQFWFLRGDSRSCRAPNSAENNIHPLFNTNYKLPEFGTELQIHFVRRSPSKSWDCARARNANERQRSDKHTKYKYKYKIYLWHRSNPQQAARAVGASTPQNAFGEQHLILSEGHRASRETVQEHNTSVCGYNNKLLCISWTADPSPSRGWFFKAVDHIIDHDNHNNNWLFGYDIILSNK